MPDKTDGLKHIINRLREGEQDSTILFTEDEIMAIRHGRASEEDRRALLEEVKKRKLVPNTDAAHRGRPEVIAREGQTNMTSNQLADLLLDKMKKASKYLVPFTGTKVNIHSWSNSTKTFRAWGDYWAWKQLGHAFTELGYHFNVDPGLAEVTIYLRGGRFKDDGHWMMPNRINKNTYNIVWIYSHPDDITPDELKDFDEVWCLSQKMVDKCKYWHNRVVDVPITSCSNMEESKVKDDRFDVLFVGNARGISINQYGRDVIKMLKDRSDLKVGIYGMKWDLPHLFWILDRGWWQGDYISYYKLPQLYGGSKIVLNDTHPDMARWGFIPMKLYDIIRSGGFPMTDPIEGLEEALPGIAIYNDKETLFKQIDHYLVNPLDRSNITDPLKELIQPKTFVNTARCMVKNSGFIWHKRSRISDRFLLVKT